MYAVINPHCRNFIDTQDFDVISRHSDINKAAGAADRNPIVVMDGERAVRVVTDIGAEPGYNPYG